MQRSTSPSIPNPLARLIAVENTPSVGSALAHGLRASSLETRLLAAKLIYDAGPDACLHASTIAAAIARGDGPASLRRLCMFVLSNAPSVPSDLPPADAAWLASEKPNLSRLGPYPSEGNWEDPYLFKL